MEELFSLISENFDCVLKNISSIDEHEEGKSNGKANKNSMDKIAI